MRLSLTFSPVIRTLYQGIPYRLLPKAGNENSKEIDEESGKNKDAWANY